MPPTIASFHRLSQQLHMPCSLLSLRRAPTFAITAVVPLIAPPSAVWPASVSPTAAAAAAAATRAQFSQTHYRPSRATMSDEAKRNPHPDFKKVEAERPKWDTSAAFRFTQTASPDWKFGDGANQLDGASDSKHVSIDPNEESRPPIFNYKLLIAGISPRPIAFLSTRSADGGAANLAPFSFFNMVSSDPPMFVVGIVPTASGSSKDTLRNLLETRECVINIISETFIEAANATAVDAPYGTSEWDVSGLTPVYDTETVRCARVQESVFSIEAKVDDVKEVKSRRKPVPVSSHIIMLEGTRFWVREDALNEEKNLIDPAILRPMSRLGGITYGRVTDAIELPRVDFKKDIGGEDGFENIKKHVE